MSTRYKIVGGIFFLSLAVIFVPMLFDEPRPATVYIKSMDHIDHSEVEPILEPDVSNVIEQKKVLRGLVDEDGFRLDTNTKVGEPALIYDLSEANAWAVQLGSFDSDEKASVFRNQLKDAGHDTWVSHAKVDDTIWTRVAAGPFHRLNEAETYRDSTIEEFDLEAIVVRFLP